MDGRRRINCSMCYFSSVNYGQLVHHYVRKHRYDPTFFVRCGSLGCQATYRNWASFKRHVFRKHPNEHVNGHNVDDAEENNMIENHVDLHDVEVGQAEDEDPMEYLQVNAAKFLLNVKDKCKTSQKAMFKIMEGVKHLVEAYLVRAMREIETQVDPYTDTINIARVRNVFEQTIPFHEIFSSVDTQSKLNRFLVDNLQFIVPLPVHLGVGMVWKRKPTVDLVEKTFYGYTIPLLGSLKRLLLNDQVRECVENPKQSGETMKSILDGRYYRNHPFFGQVRNALAIILYYDELEVANPLGSRTHKLGMFYWSLANIHPEYRSSLHAINLFAVVKYAYLVKFGIDKILRVFVDDIKQLQAEGVTVTINGAEKTYRGSLLCGVADTPAAALLGGFKRSVSATKPCRRCMTDQVAWKRCFVESGFTLRDMPTHLDHVSAVTDVTVSQEVRKFWSRHYGVNCSSLLMEIDDFDVTRCMPQDIMHVISEGSLPIALKQLIQYCIQRDFITLDTLNDRIALFDYGHLERDKPSIILPDHLANNLRESASQMVCLGYILPFILADKIVGDDGVEDAEGIERLLVHTLLLQIMNVCFAYKLSVDDAVYLRHLLETFLTRFSRFYPDALVPKFHFLIHVVQQIIDFGPPRQHYCMRFEAAHSWFKSLVPVIRNFKNMPLSLTWRYESLRCADLAGDHSMRFLYSGHSVKDGRVLVLRDSEHADMLAGVIPNIDPATFHVMISPEVSVHGTYYKRDSIIMESCEEDSLPVFGKIVEIYSCDYGIYFVYVTFETEIYSSKLNAYQIDVSALSRFKVINVTNLIHPHPLSLFSFQGQKHVVLFNHTRTEFIF